MKEICYVVVNYFSHEKVARLIRSIPPSEDICGIIVDNSADDVEFAELSSAVARLDIDCVQASHNGGFSFGTNLGLKIALDRAKAFLILNPDTVVTPKFFSSLIDVRKAIPDAVISPHGIRMGTEKIWAAGGTFFWLRGRADVLTLHRKSGETDFGTCACLLVPKEAINDVGFLDEDFFLGGEEWDFSLRLRQATWPIIYLNRAIYYHEVSGTHEKYGLRFFYIGMRTKVLFARKHYGIWFWLWLAFCFIPSSPLLILRNFQLNHGKVESLIPRMGVAVLRSIRNQKITEREFSSEGLIR